MKSNNFVNALVSGILVWLMLAATPAALARNNSRAAASLHQTTYSVVISTVQTTIGSSITVNWTAPAGHSGNDYLRLAPVNNPDGNFNWSQNLGSADTGSVVVTVPNLVDRYEFRLYRASDNIRAAQSQSFAANQANYNLSVAPSTIPAGGQISVAWNVPPGNAVTDRLVIAKTDQAPWQFISQQTANGINAGVATATAPTETGQYEVRYLKVGESAPSAISPIFTVVTAAGGFVGQITQAGNENPVSGALVEARQSGITKASFTTDVSGSYNLPVTTAGTYDLKVTAAGFPAVTRSGLAVTSGNTTIANFALSNTGSLSGRITKSVTGTAIAGANLQLKQGTTVVAAANTNGTGNYSFAQISPGTYSFVVTAPGFQSVTQSNVVLTGGNTTTLNVSLTETAPGGGSNLTEFVYDEAGRLVAAKEQGVVKSIYNYDSTGNLISITAPTGTVPAIISFSPRSGLPGTQVIIRGVNFANVAAQNTVKFNGISAAVSSTTTGEIVTVVPSGATTGAISVTTTSGTATSGLPFTVESAAQPGAPTIASFTPQVGRPGDAVIVTGTNFETEPSDNSVSFGTNLSSVDSATASTLTAQATTSSGKISVVTANGRATSTADFFSVPTVIDPAQVSFARRTWFGNRSFVEITTLDKKGVLTFDGVAGRRFSLQLFQLKNNVKIDIYRPDGKLASTSNFFGSDALGTVWFIDTQTLPLTGTYTILITPSGSSAIATRFDAIVYDVTHIFEQIPPGGSKQAWIGTPGQNAYFTYHAEAGQKILVKIDNSTHNGVATVTGQSATAVTNVPYRPATSSVQVQGGISAAYTPDGVTVPVTGDYSIAIDPTGPETGPTTASLYFVPPDPTFSTNIGSRFGLELERYPEPLPGLIAPPCPRMCLGQNAWFKFNGTAGQRISLLRQDNTHVSSLGAVNININKVNGQFLVPITQTNNGSFIDAVVLPETGEYKIFVDPSGADIGTANFNLFNVPVDIVGTTSINGAPIAASSTIPGHNPTITFNALAGQQARVNITNSTFAADTRVYLKRPDGGIVGLAYLNSATSLIGSTTLPVDGTYSVVIDPVGTNAGSATIAVGGDVFGQITPGGSAVTATINNPGQRAWLSFTGTAGQRLSLNVANSTISAADVYVINPNNTTLTSSQNIYWSGRFIEPFVLPANGTYQISIDPQSESTGSITLTLHNVPPDITRSVTLGETSVPITITAPGQNATINFAGTAGQKVGLSISGNNITRLFLGVYPPNSSVSAFKYLETSTGYVEVPTLPSSGTYRVEIDPDHNYTGSLSLVLFDSSDVIRTIVPSSSPVSVPINTPGQNAKLNFSGTAGQRVSLLVNSTTVTTSTISLIRPDGTSIAYVYGSANAFTDSQTLPATGTYSVYVDPWYDYLGSTNLTLYNVPLDVIGTIVPNGAAVPVSLQTPGQNAAITFNGTAGQRVTVKITGNTLPSAAVNLLQPNGTLITNGTVLGSDLNLESQTLPVTGTYKIIIDPFGASTGSVNLNVTTP